MIICRHPGHFLMLFENFSTWNRALLLHLPCIILYWRSTLPPTVDFLLCSIPLILSVVFKPAASASIENLLEMQTHWSLPRLTGSEALGFRPSKGCFKEPQAILIHLKLETTHLPSAQASTWLVSGTTPPKSEAFWPLITIRDCYMSLCPQLLVLCF